MVKSVNLVQPNRCHSLRADRSQITHEEMFPRFEVELGRGVGMVTVEFEANRYLHSSGWSEWRIFTLRTDPSAGIGEMTSAEIRDACVPLVLAWLESPAYRPSRKEAAASMVRRIIFEGFRSYNVTDSRRALAEFGAELTSADRQRFSRAIDHLAKACELLDRPVPVLA